MFLYVFLCEGDRIGGAILCTCARNRICRPQKCGFHLFSACTPEFAAIFHSDVYRGAVCVCVCARAPRQPDPELIW